MYWIDAVFDHTVGGMYLPRQTMRASELPDAKAAWRREARRVLDETGADHVVYCTVEYNRDNKIVEVNWYMEALADADFYLRTEATAKDANKKGRSMWIGAVHKHKHKIGG